MKRFATLMLLAFVAFSVSGCFETFTKLKKNYDVVTGAKVPANAVIVAANTFNALEITATKYLLLPRCDGVKVVCRVSSATQPIAKAVRTGRRARNELELFLRQHPGELGAKGTYDALVSASNTLQDVFAQYGINR